MQTMSFGKTGRTVSRLGFGMMRLPTVADGDKQIVDFDETKRIVRTAIDAGVSYIDTAYQYMDGESEPITGRVLKDGYREKVCLTTKLPPWRVRETADMDTLLDEQIAKLDVDHLDFYLIHAMNKDVLEKMRSLKYREFFDRAKKDGRIRYAGFSFHDDEFVFRDALDDYDWDMAQIQFNYMDEQNQATVRGVRYAGEKGVPLVIMEPLRGGVLANPPVEMRKIMEADPSGYSAVEWAFRYIADYPEIAVVLSGMSNMEQVLDNVRIFSDAKANSLTKAQKDTIQGFRREYAQLMRIPCTGCKYCQPCPKGIPIPDIFDAFNSAKIFKDDGNFLYPYNGLNYRKLDATQCVRCRKCEKACPQKIQITEQLQIAHAEYLRLKTERGL